MIGTILAIATGAKFVLDTIADGNKADTYAKQARQKALEAIELKRRREQDVLTTRNRGVTAVSNAELSLNKSGITGTSALGQLAGIESAIVRETNNIGRKFAFEINKKNTERASLESASSNLTGFSAFLSRGVNAGLSTYGAFFAGGGEFPDTGGDGPLKLGKSIFTGDAYPGGSDNA